MKHTIIAVAGLALALTACGGSSTDGTRPGAGAPDAASGTAGEAVAPTVDTAAQAPAAGESAAQPAAGQAALPAGTLPGEPATGPEQTLPSGLKIITIKEGTGELPKTGQSVSVHYTGYLTDGTKFDSSVDRGQPLPFQLGTTQIIQGWNEGIAQLKPGGKAKLVIPPALGYADQGYPPVIPPGATLIFDVELVSVQ